MTLLVSEEDFQITQGEPKTYLSTSEAGRTKRGIFCPDCGTRIYHKPDWRKGMVSVKAGTLDDTSALKPDMHIWTSSRQPWVVIPDGVERHEAQPG